MRAAKCRDSDDIDFLIASPGTFTFTCTEAARVQQPTPGAAAHDSFTRLLTRIEPDPETLWGEARGLVALNAGVLVIDDTTLDKPHARDIVMVTRHWSGKHHKGGHGDQPDHPPVDRRRPQDPPRLPLL
jgi:putative transposase